MLSTLFLALVLSQAVDLPEGALRTASGGIIVPAYVDAAGVTVYRDWAPGQPVPKVEARPSAQAAPAQPDALDEVNAHRAARGLRPFVRDPGLMASAQELAQHRAAHRIQGHVSGGMGDFGFLRHGSSASSAGAGAWAPGTGWGTCCTYENYTYAGAGYAIGADGLRYMSLFVR